MSSTRHAKPGTPLRQERFASSAEYDRGLKANLVAKRCELITDRRTRELIWWLQWQSHQEGGLERVAVELLRRNPDAPATSSMRRFGLKPSQRYNGEQVCAVRNEMEGALCFPLRGEDTEPVTMDDLLLDYESHEGRARSRIRDIERRRLANSHPDSYTAGELLKHCQETAEDKFPELLRQACIDPETNLSDSSPWYFSNLRAALLALMDAEASALRNQTVVTAVGRRVQRCLDMALKTRSLVIVNGKPRIGKSFSAASWCQQHPGCARFVEVPATNDDISFCRAIARGIGIGNFLNYKVTELRARVESVLFTGQILLVLDEAHRLWPQTNFRYGHPWRISWIMSLVNATPEHPALPILLLTPPEFFTYLDRVVNLTGWASEQFIGRILHHEALPGELSKADLEAVTRHVLPEAGAEEVAAVVAYARSSAKYLAAIDAIARTSRYLAEEAGRQVVKRSDLQRAIRESVIPSDRGLATALAATSPRGRKAVLTSPELPVEASLPTPAPDAPLEAVRPRAGAVKFDEFAAGRSMRPAEALAEA